MASKEGRKRRVLTLEKKLEVIQELKNGKSQRLVRTLYSIPKSTVADIWKDREKIERYVISSDCSSLAKRRCILREANFAKVDEACYVWFLQQRSKGAPVTGPILQEKALQFYSQFYPESEKDSFKGSTGWLTKFISRHGIRGQWPM